MILFRLLGVIGSRIESNINLIHVEAFCEELEALEKLDFRRFYRGKFFGLKNKVN